MGLEFIKKHFVLFLKSYVFEHHLELAEVRCYVYIAWGGSEPLLHWETWQVSVTHINSMHLRKPGGKHVRLPVTYKNLWTYPKFILQKFNHCW